MGLYYSGGNFQPGPGRTGFITSLVLQDNPGFEERPCGADIDGNGVVDVDDLVLVITNWGAGG